MFLTPHVQNIFDVKLTYDELSIVSCAADGYLCMTDLQTQKSEILWKASDRLKKLAVHEYFLIYAGE